MASIRAEVLQAGFDLGLFLAPLTPAQGLAFNRTIITFSLLIHGLKEGGTTSFDIAKDLGIDVSTARFFLRWGIEKKLISPIAGEGKTILYYRK